MPPRVPAVRDLPAFVLSNLLPAPLADPLMARLSRIEHPLVATLLIRAFGRIAGDLRLHEAAESHFPSLHACFTRRLRPGVRPVNDAPDRLVSPCDGQIMAAGPIVDGLLVQAKGLTYGLAELLGDPALAARCVGGTFVTLRLTPAMYHRFHAPDAGVLHDALHVPGAGWNVNPPTVRTLPRLYSRNTRAVLPMTLAGSPAELILVPVGAILVSGIVLPVVEGWEARDRRRQVRVPCRRALARGEEVGYFEHGSTIVVIATSGAVPAPGIVPGRTVRMGEPLLTRTAAPARP